MEDGSADYSCLGRCMTQHHVLAMCKRRLPAGCLFDLLRCIFNVGWCGDLNHGTGIIKVLGIFSSVWRLYGFLYISSIVSRCQPSVTWTRGCLIGNHQTMQNLPFSLPQRTLYPCHLSLFKTISPMHFSPMTLIITTHNKIHSCTRNTSGRFLQLVDHILLLIKSHCTITINLPRWRLA